MKAMALAAGKGTRLFPLTGEIPKPMAPIVDTPIIEHIFGQEAEDVLDYGGVHDRSHGLGDLARQREEPGPLAGRKRHSLHLAARFCKAVPRPLYSASCTWTLYTDSSRRPSSTSRLSATRRGRSGASP